MIVDYLGNYAAKLAVRLFLISSAAILFGANVPPLRAAIVWDAEGGSHWWFDPANWNAAGNANTVLPPSNNATGTSASETHINLGMGAWNQGEGVVYDPANDPFFDDAASIPFPGTFNRQNINHLFMSRGSPESTKLTIKGDLMFQERVHIGSSSGTRGVATNATVVQESGVVEVLLQELDLAQVNTSIVGYGNGVYDYRSGTLEVSQLGGNGFRMSVGSNTPTSDGMKAGPAGVGRFIVHNPGTPGRIRAYNVVTAFFAGFDEGVVGNPNDSVFNPAFDANGVSTGVGIFEFHYENGGTRPIQVNQNLSLNNGMDQNTKGTRSSLLDFVVDSAACAGAGCVPNDVGLFDVDFDGIGGLLLGSGDLDGNGIFNDDRVFSNITDTDDYREGDTVSATFGSVKYNWTISYTGDISWTDADAGVVGAVTGPGTGIDIVLIGHSSEPAGVAGDFDGDGDVDGRDFLIWQRGGSPNALSAGDLSDWESNYGTGAPLASFAAVPEPSSLLLLCAAVPLLARRR